MNEGLGKKVNVLYLILFLIIICLLVALYNEQAYVAIDTTIYTIIGKDIFESLTLPYGNTFDHKPLVTYYIYGLFHYLVGQDHLYLSIAFVCTLSSALVLSDKNLNKFLVIGSFLLVSSFLIEDFSGNSEMLMLPFICLYIFFYTSRINEKYQFFLIGATAAVLFNINYLAAPIMMPITLYMFFSKGFEPYVCRILKFLAGFLFLCFILFLPFYLTHQSLTEYFTLQYQFLTGYSGSASRLTSLIYLSKFIVIFFPIAIFYVMKAERDKSFYVTLLLYAGTIFGAFVSDRGYSHYLEPMVIPLSIMFWAVLTQEKARMLVVIFLPIALALAYLLPLKIDGLNKINYIKTYQAQQDLSHLNKLARIDNNALNIRSTHLVYLYSDLKNFNKFIWSNHPQIVFGNHANDYYIKELGKSPYLVMTAVDMCDEPNEICNLINSNYVFDSTSKIHTGYDLYVRK